MRPLTHTLLSLAISTTDAATIGRGGRPNPFITAIIPGSVFSVVILAGIITLIFTSSLYFCNKNGLGTSMHA